MIIIDNIEQGTDQWKNEKAGKPSSSNFSKIVTTKGAPSKSSKDYMYQLAGELVTGRPEASYSNATMEEGVQREAESRVLFSAIHGMEIQEVGMVYKDELRNVLCSPDGIMPDHDCGLELKNPMMKTQAKYLDKGVLPTEYFCQVQGSLWVTGYSHWWFCSYVPGMAPLILKVERNEAWISKLEAEMNKFTAELALMHKKLKAM